MSCKLTQRELAIALTISKTTMTRWELDTIEIPNKKLIQLIEFLKQKQLHVTIEWFSFGIGVEPIIGNRENLQKLNFDEISYNTLCNLKNQINNFEILQLNTNFITPFLNAHDYVGCVFTNDYVSLDQKFCVWVTDKEIIAGIYNYKKNITKLL